MFGAHFSVQNIIRLHLGLNPPSRGISWTFQSKHEECTNFSQLFFDASPQEHSIQASTKGFGLPRDTPDNFLKPRVSHSLLCYEALADRR